MGRIRSIYPDACVSETLSRISPRQERTFWRLLTHCDDRGRAKAEPRLIKAAIYPLHDDMTPDEVMSDMKGLEGAGLIQFYTVEGRAYLFVTSWDEFQHPKNPSPSKLPEHPQASPSPTPGLPQDYPSPNPLELGVGEGVGEGEGGGKSAQAPNTKRGRKEKQDHLTPFPPETREVVDALFSEWHREDGPPAERRTISISVPQWGENLGRIFAENANLTPGLLIAAARRYLAEEHLRYKAPQFFFGPQGPWRGYVQTELTKIQLAEVANG